MPWSVEIRTNFWPWAKRKLKRAIGETLLAALWVGALLAELLIGAWSGVLIAYHDWQLMRAELNYRKTPR